MGKQAREKNHRERDALGAQLLREAEAWAAPASADESAAFAAVLALPRVKVRRMPNDQLLEVGMLAKDSHANCAQWAANDPTRTEQITGWWVRGPALVLHSVVKSNGTWLCLTPQLTPMPSTFDFIADTEIEWRDDGDGHRTALRNGFVLPETGLRQSPEAHIKFRDRLLELVREGKHPVSAYDIVEHTIGAEIMDIQLA